MSCGMKHGGRLQVWGHSAHRRRRRPWGARLWRLALALPLFLPLRAACVLFSFRGLLRCRVVAVKWRVGVGVQEAQGQFAGQLWLVDALGAGGAKASVSTPRGAGQCGAGRAEASGRTHWPAKDMSQLRSSGESGVSGPAHSSRTCHTTWCRNVYSACRNDCS